MDKLLGRTENRTHNSIMLSLDPNSLRDLPRRSSMNCDLELANTDIQTDLRIIIV